MQVRVLIVDDSSFFRTRISDVLGSDSRIEIVGTAVNGREAIEKVKQLKPDLVTMDVEMPQLNGIEAVRIIMRECPTNVLMLSSLTHEGARVTLQALEAGAADYVSKDIRAWIDKSDSMRSELIERVVSLARSKQYRRHSVFRDSGKTSSSTTMVFGRSSEAKRPVAAAPAAARPAVARPLRTSPPPVAERTRPQVGLNANRTVMPNAPVPADTPVRRVKRPDCKLVVIGSSTGGPAALQQILMELPANFPYPILLVQHMPKTFTAVFAQRLDQQCAIAVKEAEDGDRLVPGQALLAPGGHQMVVDGKGDRIRVLPGDERLTYKPSVDVTYASAAKAFGARVLGVILTGMGADGCDGAKLLKQAGSTMWAQNKESCTIYGMPQAVINAGLADAILDLNDIGPLLANKNLYK